jgi:hypothetical protein
MLSLIFVARRPRLRPIPPAPRRLLAGLLVLVGVLTAQAGWQADGRAFDETEIAVVLAPLRAQARTSPDHDPSTFLAAATTAVARHAAWLELADSLGVADPVATLGLEAACAAENERRSRAVAAGEIVYGPQRFSLRGYHVWWRGQLFLALRETLAAAGPPWPEAELRAFYDAHRTTVFAPGRDGRSRRFEDVRDIAAARLWEQRLHEAVEQRAARLRSLVIAPPDALPHPLE